MDVTLQSLSCSLIFVPFLSVAVSICPQIVMRGWLFFFFSFGLVALDGHMLVGFFFFGANPTHAVCSWNLPCFKVITACVQQPHIMHFSCSLIPIVTLPTVSFWQIYWRLTLNFTPESGLFKMDNTKMHFFVAYILVCQSVISCIFDIPAFFFDWLVLGNAMCHLLCNF